MCQCDAFSIMDLRTPRNEYLSAFYKRSFAYYTVKNRMPIILTNLIDTLVRRKRDIMRECGEQVKEELKTVIGEISEFKYEIQTNKPLKLLNSKVTSAKIYDDYITELTEKNDQPTHFHTVWLLAECYMYRRLKHIFETTSSMQNFDPFGANKEESFEKALPLTVAMGESILEILTNGKQANAREFAYILKLNLWGNKCDLSLSLGNVENLGALLDVASLDAFIVCDKSKSIWEAVSSTTSCSNTIDIILDNAGYELFTDLCLADYVIEKRLASKVRIYFKTIPWFISDVTLKDFNWTVLQLKENDHPSLEALGTRWSEYLENGTWELVESEFWTLPFDYSLMSKKDPALYTKLAEAKLAIYKGDLNYRKLFGERNWDPTTPVADALQGFHPTKLGIVRTIKSDIVCGLREGVVEKAEKIDPKWMEMGNFGVIQFSEKVVENDLESEISYV